MGPGARPAPAIAAAAAAAATAGTGVAAARRERPSKHRRPPDAPRRFVNPNPGATTSQPPKPPTADPATPGFLYLPSFGEMFEATGSEEARRQVLAAAEATAWAFNPDTGSLRTFEGWEPPEATNKFKCARAAAAGARGRAGAATCWRRRGRGGAPGRRAGRWLAPTPTRYGPKPLTPATPHPCTPAAPKPPTGGVVIINFITNVEVLLPYL
jgi:hypothetical protein